MFGRKIFHGWYLVAVGLIVGAFSTGAGTWAVSLFVLPMTAELGWSRPEFYGALTVRSLAAGFLGPVIGPFVDTKHGPRVMMFATALSLGLGMALLKFIDNNLIVFYLIFGLVSALTNIGGSDMMLSAVLPKWFVRYRARAIAIASSGAGAGPLVFPLFVSAIIQTWGWRDAWFALGMASLAVLFPLSFLVATRPEDMGLLPDGDDHRDAVAGAARRVEGRSFTRGEAMREPSFWLLAVSTSLLTMGLVGLQTSWLVYFQETGFSAPLAASSASAFGVGSFSSRFLWGWLAGRFAPRKLMVVGTMITALTVVPFFFIGANYPLLLLVSLVHGLALGGNLIMRPLLVADYFGRNHLGAISGLMRPFNTLASASGPLIVTGLYELTQSWYVAFGSVMLMWVISGLSVITAGPPSDRKPAPLTAA